MIEYTGDHEDEAQVRFAVVDVVFVFVDAVVAVVVVADRRLLSIAKSPLAPSLQVRMIITANGPEECDEEVCMLSVSLLDGQAVYVYVCP